MQENFFDKNSTQGIMIINGQTINLFDIQPRQISMPKMVRGLHGVIRFNGYSDWSVAQHSLILSCVVEGAILRFLPILVEQALEGDAESKQLLEKFDLMLFLVVVRFSKDKTKRKGQVELFAKYIALLFAYDALIHDFSEALTGDIIRPFKRMIGDISVMEAKIDRQIRNIYSALPEMPLLVDLFDKQLAAVEAYYLTRFYGKTLLNETDDFHIRAFNSSFVGNEASILLKNLIGLSKIRDDEPITDKDLLTFLSYSKFSINDVKSLSCENLIATYIDRSVKIRAEYERINLLFAGFSE